VPVFFHPADLLARDALSEPDVLAVGTSSCSAAFGQVAEIKLDGYRAITVFDSGGKSQLWSRNGLALEAKFPALHQVVQPPFEGSSAISRAEEISGG
jgi:ATP-dependent DNA ligase